MPFDNFTIHKYRALKPCPQGQAPGEIFEATEDAGNILKLLGLVEQVADEDPKREKRTYKRRDLRAEDE